MLLIKLSNWLFSSVTLSLDVIKIYSQTKIIMRIYVLLFQVLILGNCKIPIDVKPVEFKNIQIQF